MYRVKGPKGTEVSVAGVAHPLSGEIDDTLYNLIVKGTKLRPGTPEAADLFEKVGEEKEEVKEVSAPANSNE